MKKPLIGLTGGIASGKTTVGKFFKKYGVVVIDADDVSRETTVAGSECLDAIVTEFGRGLLTDEGELRRKSLGALVFRDPEALQRLNEITHPYIWERSLERIREAMDTEAPYVVYDAALHVETGLYKKMDKLVVIGVEPELQIKRMIKRNGLTRESARLRLEAQAPLSERLKFADYVIENDNDRTALEQRTKAVHEKLLELTQAEV